MRLVGATAGAGAAIGTFVKQPSGYNAATNTPDLDVTPIANIKIGFSYLVSADGDFFTEAVEIGDTLIACVDNPTALDDWIRLNKNIDNPGTVGAADKTLDIRAANEGTIPGTTLRGEGSVDLQTSRTVGDQVAAGDESFIGPGHDSKIEPFAFNAAIPAGSNNTITTTGDQSVIHGAFNTSSGLANHICGSSNNASGVKNSVSGAGHTVARDGCRVAGQSGIPIIDGEDSFSILTTALTRLARRDIILVADHTDGSSAELFSSAVAGERIIIANDGKQVSIKGVAQILDINLGTFDEWDIDLVVGRATAISGGDVTSYRETITPVVDSGSGYVLAVSYNTSNQAVEFFITAANGLNSSVSVRVKELR